MTALRAWLAERILGPRCDLCRERFRGWRTLLAPPPRPCRRHPMSDEPTERDVEALAEEVWADEPTTAERDLIHVVLTSDWFTERIAQAEQRGREDNADHAMCLVSGSKALAAREAQARREGAAEGWTDALRWVRQYAENTTPDMAIQHIDRAEPFNPHRAALRDDA